MKQQFTDVYTSKYFDEVANKEKFHKEKYTIVYENNKVKNVFNHVFTDNGGWGHSVNKNSETFSYFSSKYDR